MGPKTGPWGGHKPPPESVDCKATPAECGVFNLGSDLVTILKLPQNKAARDILCSAHVAGKEALNECAIKSEVKLCPDRNGVFRKDACR